MLPWTDRTGRFAPLKCAALAVVLVPALWIPIEARWGWLGERPVVEAIHQSGLWAIRLLAATLAVTPLKLALRWPKLIAVRRILGVSVLAYALLHLSLYIMNQHFDLAHVASEIILRIYLTIGFMAFCGLFLLGVTSTDGMIAWLGAARWLRLHRLVYAITILATVHFFMQSKLDITQPIIMAGVFSLLLGYRIARRRLGDLSPSQTGGLALAVALATALGEAVCYAFSYNAPLIQVLAANLDFSYAVRPFWFVLGVGFILFIARLGRPWMAGETAASIPRLRRSSVGTGARPF
ncbi:MAG TPA: protein-methionine-sulfoxide reductase heme-binding subunit MsrQ [Methylocella sp.]|nr:protein-methionine-sulfoxide reductase heme-binding subunit MsrQ [Methylocella sp.]